MKKPYPAFAIFFMIFTLSVCFSVFFAFIILDNKNKVTQITKDLTLRKIPSSLSDIKVSVLLSSLRQEFERSMFASDRSLRNESAYNVEKIRRAIQAGDDDKAKGIVSDVIELIALKDKVEQDVASSRWTILDGAIQKHAALTLDNSFDEIAVKLIEVEAAVAKDVSVFRVFTWLVIVFQTVVLIAIFRVFIRPLAEIEKNIDNGNISDEPDTYSDGVRYSQIKELFSLQSAIDELHLTTRENEKMHKAIATEMEKAKIFAEEKAEFLSGMSHEINTPLATLGIIIYLIEQTNLNEPQKLYVARLTLSVNYLRTLMERVLKISRMDANKLELESLPFGMNEVVDEVYSMWEPVASRKHIRLHASVDGNIPHTLVGDRLNVKEILVNFTDNAIKFTSSGDVRIEVKVESKNSYTTTIVLAVIDTGQGVAAEDLSLLFQRFSQVNKKSFAGTGLGLAITKGLAELMGGSVGVASSVGIGSKFWAKIPLSSPDTSEHETPEQMDDSRRVQNHHSDEPQPISGDVQTLLKNIYMYARNDLPVATTLWLQNESKIMESIGKDAATLGDLLRKFSLQQAADRLSWILGAPAGNADAVPVASGHKPSVLVIDDTPGNLELFSALLAEFATIRVASDPDRGIEIAQTASEISLIILDVSMPVKDGFDVISELKEHPAARRIPVIMISALESHDTRARCLASGAAEFIDRGTAPDKIEALVRKYVLKNN